MRDWGGESGRSQFPPPGRAWLPTRGRAGSHPFRASVKGVCGAKKVGAGRAEHTVKCVKDTQRSGVGWAPPM